MKFNLKLLLEIKLTVTSNITLQVWRLPLYPQQGDVSNSLTLGFATKEKKQKSKLMK